jgi:arylsulfatase A-like enzyme
MKIKNASFGGLLFISLFLFLIPKLTAESGTASTLQGNDPNIIYILVDDLGYGDLSCFGAQDIHTPAIDTLAEEGMKLTNFYSASPVCSPSRAGLLTGRYPVRMGINGVFFPDSFTGLDPVEITLAETLKKDGYRTGIMGKWHLGHREPFLPLQQGFDEYFGIPYSNDMSMLVYMRGNSVESYEVDQSQMTQRLTKEAVSFVERSVAGEQPFFLLLSHPMPHVPLYVSDAFKGTSGRGLYGDVVQELDWSVGILLERLADLGISDNTLVVFTSDNGPWLAMRDLGGSPGFLKSGKFYTFEGGMRVPTLVRWPGHIPANSVSRAPASMLDWHPTLTFLADAEPPDVAIDGHNISSQLTGIDPEEPRPFIYFRPDGDVGAYRNGRWKLKLPMERRENTRWRHGMPAHPLALFDLAADPGESKNLVDEHPDVVKRLQEELADQLESLGPLPPSLIMYSPADTSHFKHLYPED